MRHVVVIGIGMSPKHLTLEAVEALATVDVVIQIGKAGRAPAIDDARATIRARHAPQARLVTFDDPERHPSSSRSGLSPPSSSLVGAPSDGPLGPRPEDYRQEVDAWHLARADQYEQRLRDDVDPGGTAAILVWGDASIYDGTLRVLDTVGERVAIDVRVIPGITAVQALAAAHRIPLHQAPGAPFVVMSARALGDDLPADDVVVLLDGHPDLHLEWPEGTTVYWGMYLGSSDEVTVAGPVAEVADRIRTLRAEAKAANGWVLDTYLLRRPQEKN